ncbi:MAG TPA: ABC transporter ATP-binding protein [Acidobacteriota bacterium]|nr:ABC transporter ATP-binding protein [Acidobacteriota bacterium]
MNVLTLTDGGVNFGQKWLVRGASLVLRPGSLTALVGPNGSGKTTLLKCLAGLITPTEGTVVLDGKSVRGFPRRELARKITFVPQDTHLAFAFTVRDVVAMGRHPHLRRFELETVADRQAIESALIRADVAHLSQRNVIKLSGGERQRVILARSLATEAPIILLDEPTASLDIAHALDVLELCRQLADEGKTVACALHDLNLVNRYATQVVMLSAGQVAAVGTPAAVLTSANIESIFHVRAECVAASHSTQLFDFQRLPV